VCVCVCVCVECDDHLYSLTREHGRHAYETNDGLGEGLGEMGHADVDGHVRTEQPLERVGAVLLRGGELFAHISSCEVLEKAEMDVNLLHVGIEVEMSAKVRGGLHTPEKGRAKHPDIPQPVTIAI